MIELSSCDNAVVTLNSCEGMNINIPGSGNTTESYVYFTNCTNSEISKNKFGNHDRAATGFYVHAYYLRVDGGSDNVIRNNLLYDNHIENVNWTNTYNYCLWGQSSPNLEVYNNTLDNMGPNKTTDDSGGTQGIRISSCNGLQLYNNIVTNLYSYRYVDGLYISMWPAPEQTYSNVWGLVANFSVRRYYPPEAEGEGCIEADPMYSDPDNGDYTFLPGSPCEGTGRIGGIASGDPTDMGCHGGSDPLPE
jgi:hypothetical protein